MTFKTATPGCFLSVQDVRLAWTSSYQYLGCVWLEQGLTFTTQARYLKKRTQARISVLRAMTRTHAAATYSLLRLFYVQGVRALVDYSAPVLVALSPSQQKKARATAYHPLLPACSNPGRMISWYTASGWATAH